jgi:uncharacterized protein (TIGR03067 family)
MNSSVAEVEQLLQAARLHLAKGELQETVERATEAIRLNGKESAAYHVRAEAHRRLKRPERALADLAVAIRLDPNQPSPYVIRAEILKRRNVLDQAIADATHALTLDPRNAAAFSLRAECRGAIGDVEGANEDVQEMLLVDPTRSVPDLRAKSLTGDPSLAMVADDERLWKQSGNKSQDEDRAIFADGKPVDRSLKARKPVGRDAAEILADMSDYRPEVLPSPLPRGRASRYASSRSPWQAVALIGVLLAFAAGVVFATRNSAPNLDARAVAVRSSDTDVTSATAVEAEQKRSSVAALETPPIRPQQSPSQRTAIPAPPIADAVPSVLPRAAGPRPPDDAVTFNGHSFKFFPEVLPWHRAKARCEEMGGHLAIIRNREENDFVMSLALRGITRLGPQDGVWLGATDEQKEGAWEWVDGSKLSFTRWGPGQPNNKQNREHYLLLFLPKNEWSDQPNESTQHVAYFVCEWDSGSAERAATEPVSHSGSLQGEWLMVSEEANGVTVSITQERRIIITGDDFVMSGTPDGRHPTYVGKIKINEATRTFDFDGKGPFGTTQVFKGIYELDGDTLRMCYAYIDEKAFERPTRIRSYQVPNTTMVSLTLRRSSIAKTSSVPSQGQEVNLPNEDSVVARWVLSKAGRLTIELDRDKSVVEVELADRLPKTEFQIVKIDLSKCNVSDYDVRMLSRLKRIEEVNLLETDVGDAAMSILTRLSSLKHLTVQDTRVTDAGLSDIARLTNVRHLNLAGLSIGVRGLSQVGRLTQLETLLLGGVQANDDAIGELGKLSNLRLLGLHFNRAVTNSAIPRLRNLQNLETIRLKDTRISDAVVKRYLPKCEIER